ncbi:MAG: ArsR family transcriptional regulator [Thermoplasmatales archaeon]|nr:ArsR family transcriptional regulator [Thermoplasmatales archaeon]
MNVMPELDEKDEQLIKNLVKAGLQRNIAKALVYLKKVEESTSVEIERAARLRQPEVSIAMQVLEKKGWIVKKDIKKEGKGRPVYKYRLSKPFSEIVAEIENDLNKKIEEIKSIIDGLKSY